MSCPHFNNCRSTIVHCLNIITTIIIIIIIIFPHLLTISHLHLSTPFITLLSLAYCIPYPSDPPLHIHTDHHYEGGVYGMGENGQGLDGACVQEEVGEPEGSPLSPSGM